MKVRNSLITLILAVMVLCAGVGSTTASPAAQTVPPGCTTTPVITYYTDASMTVVCGVWDVCAGTYPDCWTDYTTRIRKVCCDPK
jgi:hypothetical protein